MLFSSPSFLFLFLPLTLLAYFVAKVFRRIRLENAVLLFFSLVFYAWGELRFVPLLLLSILVNYGLGLALGPLRSDRARRLLLIGGLILNLGTLAVFKYAGFFVANLNAVLSMLHFATRISAPKLTMPLGISFFTFHALSYLFDIERRRLPPQRDLFTFALYIVLFPQLIAGPIIRYHDLAASLEKRSVTLEGFSRGVLRFSFGLAKKMLIANNIGPLADQLFRLGDKGGLSCAGAWLASATYALQIYFDFSGYTDMAIALGAMFGFPFPENFKHPFTATSISDYWRRWHISLTNWLREYLYTPLALALARRAAWALPAAIVITMSLSGLWHGAAWNFILWGFFFGVIMACEQGFLGRYLRRAPRWAQHVYALGLVLVSFVLFRATSAAQCFGILRSMFDPRRAGHFAERALVTPRYALCLGIAVLLSLPLDEWLRPDAPADAASASSRLAIGTAWAATVFALGLFLLASAQVAAGTYNPFIYFRF